MKKVLLIVGLTLLGYTAVVMTVCNGIFPPSLMTASTMTVEQEAEAYDPDCHGGITTDGLICLKFL